MADIYLSYFILKYCIQINEVHCLTVKIPTSFPIWKVYKNWKSYSTRKVTFFKIENSMNWGTFLWKQLVTFILHTTLKQIIFNESISSKNVKKFTKTQQLKIRSFSEIPHTKRSQKESLHTRKISQSSETLSSNTLLQPPNYSFLRFL